MREFEEEVNPSSQAQWSAAAAFEPENFELISLQNFLCQTDIQKLQLGARLDGKPTKNDGTSPVLIKKVGYFYGHVQ